MGVLFYDCTDSEGENKQLGVSNSIVSTVSYSNITLDRILSLYPQFITLDTTIISNNTDQITLLRNYGFTNIINSNNDGYRLTFSNNSYIEFTYDGDNAQRYYFYDSNGTNKGGFYSGKPATGHYDSYTIKNNNSYYIQLHDLHYNQTSYKYIVDTFDIRFINDTAVPTIKEWYNNLTTNNPYPYDPGGTSETGGGDGSFDNASTDITPASTPVLSTVDMGFCSLYHLTLEQLQDFSGELVSGSFDFSDLKKLFSDVKDALISIHELPITPLYNETAEKIRFGKILTSSAEGYKITSQYVDVNCGSLTVSPYWNNCLDYSPYTRLELYLPFVGYKDIDVDDIMGRTISVKYRIDVLSGACNVFVIRGGTTVLYQFTGNCAMSIPTSSEDHKNLYSNAISVVGATTGVVATALTGGTSAQLAAAVIGYGTTTANAVVGSKANISHGGVTSGAVGFLAQLTPYLIIHRARQCIPANYGSFYGYPSNIYKILNNLTGYTMVDDIHLENITATEAEKDEIETLLKGGVLL